MQLHANVIPVDILEVFKSWLFARKARVAVGGKFSRDMVIRDMVYQGTVLGPPLWNIVFEYASMAIRSHEFCKIVFPDDLNACKDFEITTGNQVMFS